MNAHAADAYGRTVAPDGDLCKRMRIDKGWDVTEMAAKVGLTKKTVESIEAGNRCFVFTLKAFSDAFGLPDIKPLLKDPNAVPPRITGADRVQFKIRLSFPFADRDFTSWLIWFINKLIKLIDPKGEFEVLAVAPGSTIITIEMTADDAGKAVSSFAAGELNDLHIRSITTNFGSGEPVEFKPIPRNPVDSNSPKPSNPASSPQRAPEKSLFERFSTWLFGEGSQSSDSPTYKEKSSSIFSNRMLRKD
jgi:transcriptional regulator with XRE-family HTH domain